MLIEKELVNSLMNDDIQNIIYDELQDYYIFYNNEETRDIIWFHSNLKHEFNGPLGYIRNLEL